MTRILVLSDIHGNYPALQAVSEQADIEACDYIFNCGDCTVYAPFANEVLEWLTNNGVVSIRGNTDDKVIKLLNNQDFKKPGNAEKRIMYTHTAETLTSKNQSILKRLKKKKTIVTGGIRISLFHGSPAKHTEFLFADTPDKHFRKLAQKCRADIIITGHSHTPYHKIIGDTHFINPGSVGRMFDGLPKASFAIMELNEKKVKVDLVRCAYDVEEVATRLANADLPDIYADMYRLGRKLN